MSIAPRDLPPFGTLIALEAVVRLGSFTAAAKELRVSQSAVSQKVRELESWLGRDLIVRSRPHLAITEEGLRVAESVRFGITSISRSLAAARRENKNPNRVILATTNAFALYWLGPRLESFYAAHPEVELNLITSDREVTTAALEFDLGVTFSVEPPPGYFSEVLFETGVVAIASRAYLESRPRHLGPAQWPQDTLLHLTAEPWMPWTTWLDRVNLAVNPDLRAIYHSTFITLIQAVQSGQGMSLGWRVLVDPLMAGGDLCRVGDLSAKPPGAYYLLGRMPLATRALHGIQVLRSWFQNQDAV